jgi:ZIP family zinc transporter
MDDSDAQLATEITQVPFSPDQVVWLVLPALALVIGALLSVRIRIGARSRSGLQHLAAGVVTAAVAVDLVPEMIGVDRIPAVLIGFTIGTALVLTLKALGSDSSKAGSDQPRKITSIVGAVGLDLAVDGLLVGIAIAVSGSGAMLGIAIAIETLALGLALGGTLSKSRLATVRILLLMLGLGVLLFVSGLLGLGGAGLLAGSVQTGVVAFGAAALLYLVVEELLVEAHERGDTTLGSLLFFVGFAGGVLLANLEA